MKHALRARVAAEFIGTAFLVSAVVGSGVMGEKLSDGNVALALLANTLATGAALVALISAFMDASGAHFNPVVTLTDALAGRLPRFDAAAYIVAQFAGGIAGILVAHAMFGLPALSLSVHPRHGWALVFSEFVATFGLLLVIRGCSYTRPSMIPGAVGCYIAAAYWFTASTSFANPAVTVARSLTNTFSGIQPADVPLFTIAQLLGGVAASVLAHRLFVPLPSDSMGSNCE